MNKKDFITMKTFNHTFRFKGLGLALLPVYLCAAVLLSSCQDMMETDSNRQIFNPALDQKTDSIFYTLGILKGVQQAIDQYVLVGEMRGDLTTTNQYTETALRQLYNFSYDGTNKYDSAYVWYRVINNCNYYVAHRDTTLMTGSRYVARSEYAQALSIRAWAYMQLAKTYGTVPFFTYPITSISEAELASKGEKKDLKGIVDALAPELQKFSGITVPTYGTIDAGKTNAGDQKNVATKQTMFPVDLVLGDMYLETNQYEKAAKSYWTYVRDNRLTTQKILSTPNRWYTFPNNETFPSDMSGSYSYSSSWSSCFSISSPKDVITYVPMGVNKIRGTATNLPKLFGWDYYTTSVDTTAINNGTGSYNAATQYVLERQIDPSPVYLNLANSQLYYYQPQGSKDNTVSSVRLGDMRRQSTLQSVTKTDSTFFLMTKYEGGNINIYRTGVIYLRLAEALNRMGYPDAAFAILKDGLGDGQLAMEEYTTDTLGNYVSGYVRDTTYTMLETTVPFLSEAYYSYFSRSLSSTSMSSYSYNYGIHSRGCGEAVEGPYSGYQYATEILNKRRQLGNYDGEAIDSTFLYGPAAIDAVEDLICDEYALEAAFEGSRFGDLTRIARHKNAAEFGGANYGGQWLAEKLAFKHPAIDLTQEKNWFMPYR